MYLLILYFPLIGSFSAIFFARFLGKNGSSLIVLFYMFLSLLTSLFIFYEVILCNNICVIQLCKWIYVGFLNIY